MYTAAKANADSGGERLSCPLDSQRGFWSTEGMKAAAQIRFVILLVAILTAGCRSTSAPPDASGGQRVGKVADSGASTEGSGRGLEACVDAWLREKKLDPYGHPEGTMYAGGTPLFDERTGERKDRLAYVLERHPDARSVCPDGGR